MDEPPRQRWGRAALIAGLLYLVIGRWFPNPANDARAWRLAAWLLSGVVYAAHFRHEHFRLRSSPRSTAFHVAAGVAIGAFALAVAAMIPAFSARPETRLRWLVALVAWPAITAIPAWLVTLVAAKVLGRTSRGAAAGDRAPRV